MRNERAVDFGPLHTLEVKGIAILFMLFHHLFAYREEVCRQYGVSAYPLGMQTIGAMAVAAKICVSLFVFLSAFGITRSYNAKLAPGQTAMDRRAVGKFAWKRYVKMMINYEFIFICAFLFQSVWCGEIVPGYRTDGTLKAVLYGVFDALGLASFMNTPTINVTWWYMSIASLMVFIIPCLIRWLKKDGSLVLIICGFAPYFDVTGTSFGRYLFVIAAGIFCAEYRVIERITDIKLFLNEKLEFAVKLLLEIFVFAALYFIRMRVGYDFWVDGLIAFDVCLLVYLLSFTKTKKIFAAGLAFIGKHSMSIFLTHTFIYYYYFTDFIYSFGNFVFVFAALLASSLILAVVLDTLKKMLRVGKLIGYVTEKIGSE